MQFILNAKSRTVQGSGASRRLRRAGTVPAVVYGGNEAAQSIELDHNQILLSLNKEAFHSSVLTLDLEGKKQSVLLRDYQVHAYKPLVLHVDFQRIDENQPIHQKVPLHFVNADVAPGVKLHGGQISHIMNELEITCLPKDLPEFIEVDLKDMGPNQSLHVSDIKLPAGVKAAAHGGEGAVVANLTVKKGSA